MAFLNWVAKLFVISCLILGVAFNAITLRGCNILSVKHNDVTVGIFGLEVRGGGCIPYPEDQTTDFAVLLQASENPYMRTAQAGSIAGLSFGVLAFVFLVMDQFLCRVPGARCLTRYDTRGVCLEVVDEFHTVKFAHVLHEHVFSLLCL